jgi:hypothetical protein
MTRTGSPTWRPLPTGQQLHGWFPYGSSTLTTERLLFGACPQLLPPEQLEAEVLRSRQGLLHRHLPPLQRDCRWTPPQSHRSDCLCRVRMAELAAATSDAVMVDGWEAAQPGWQRTLAVLRRLSVVRNLGLAFRDLCCPTSRPVARLAAHPGHHAPAVRGAGQGSVSFVSCAATGCLAGSVPWPSCVACPWCVPSSG